MDTTEYNHTYIPTAGKLTTNVNHSKNFVNCETGVYTQNIERTWQDVRFDIPRFGRRENHFDGYLANTFFKKFPNHCDRLLHFFKYISEVYP
ncbi:hypothetical protein NQ318_007776, partial [Aromia moschata]